MSEINFIFNNVNSVISYDLSRNDVSATEIANQSNHLHTKITMKNKDTYELPNTTLWCSLSRDKAKAEFKTAFAKTDSNASISKLFIVEVGEKSAFIKD